MNSPTLPPSYDFVMVDQHDRLPHQDLNNLSLQTKAGMILNPVKDSDTALITVVPPKRPETDVQHVPCDIVLVIDCSGSMGWMATLPDVADKNKPESTGLSILDLTKHAAKTILATLNEGDRLAIVKYSYDAHVVQPLMKMTAKNKVQADKNIDALKHDGATNLWGGIKAGLKVFEDAPFQGHVQGLFILTDGQPNHMCPKQGYAPKLGPMLKEMALKRPCIPTIHTFGFGYGIRSGLLQSIAELGNGNYAFIPDAGMIGTVFVHSVANLYSTYGVDAHIHILPSEKHTITIETELSKSVTENGEVIIDLGNIQYGQTRDLVVRCSNVDSFEHFNAKLIYKLPEGTICVADAMVKSSDMATYSKTTLNYHIFRTQLCKFLASLFPTNAEGEHKVLKSHTGKLALPTILDTEEYQGAQLALTKLLTDLQPYSRQHEDQDANLASLYSDINGPDPEGQISQAVITTSDKPYWTKWGQHYLPSLLHAHMRQTCNSFKDPGPLRYGIESPLFLKCRNELDTAFEALPPPKPSINLGKGSRGNFVPVTSMSRYHNRNNPCFLGSCGIQMWDGTTKPIGTLQSGEYIWSPLVQASRRVIAVVKTVSIERDRKEDQMDDFDHDNSNTVCKVGRLWVTPYHPILCTTLPSWSTSGNTPTWKFPIDVKEQHRRLSPGEAIYSVLLAPSSNPDAHAIRIENMTAVTLGHGLTTVPGWNSGSAATPANSDVRAHPYLGDYAAVSRDIANLPIDVDNIITGVRGVQKVSGGIVKSVVTGLAGKFVGPPLPNPASIELAVEETTSTEVPIPTIMISAEA